MILRRAAVVAAVLTLVAIDVPRGAAQEPSSPCMAPVASAPPAATPEQERYRERLHSLATGVGITVAVIDTGIAQHPELPRLNGGPDLVSPDSPDPFFDCDIHGTVVAGIIGSRTVGIAPDVALLSIRQSSAHYSRHASDPDEPTGAGTLATLTQALNAALDAGAHVINLSVVSCLPSGTAARLDTKPLDAALRRAEDAGVIVVAAAGNAGSGCEPGDVVFPSHGPTVLSVAALAAPHEFAAYSMPGQVSAPGDVPVGLGPDGWINGDMSPAQIRGEAQPLMGTSFAAPVVTATAALLRQRLPDASAAEIREHILGSAQPGTGFVDPLAAVSALPADYAGAPRTVTIEPEAVRASLAPHRLALLISGLSLGAFVLSLIAGARRRA